MCTANPFERLQVSTFLVEAVDDSLEAIVPVIQFLGLTPTSHLVYGEFHFMLTLIMYVFISFIVGKTSCTV